MNAELASVVDECAERWGLQVEESFPHASAAVVVPARTADGEDVVLKVQVPHRESEHEAEALRVWDGDGAVRLLAHDPGAARPTPRALPARARR